MKSNKKEGVSHETPDISGALNSSPNAGPITPIDMLYSSSQSWREMGACTPKLRRLRFLLTFTNAVLPLGECRFRYWNLLRMARASRKTEVEARGLPSSMPVRQAVEEHLHRHWKHVEERLHRHWVYKSKEPYRCAWPLLGAWLYNAGLWPQQSDVFCARVNNLPLFYLPHISHNWPWNGRLTEADASRRKCGSCVSR